MAKAASKKKVDTSSEKQLKGRAETDEPFDPVEWLIKTHPATASWLGHDLTKERRKR